MWIRPFSIAHAETRGFLDSPASAFALFQGIRSAEAAEIWLNDGSWGNPSAKCHENAKGSVEKTGFIVYVRSMNELFESGSPMARYTRHHATWSLLGLDAWQPFRCWCCGPWSASTKDWCAKNFHSKLIPLLAKKIHSWKTEEIYFCSPFGSIMN